MARLPLLPVLIAASACAHAPAAPCTRAPETPPAPVAEPPPGVNFADAASLAQPEPLALYDLEWRLMTGDSGALAELPRTLHSFTLGRWECALGAEKSRDRFDGGRAQLARSRTLACTHATGITMKSELACGYAAPSPVAAGAPRLTARREVRVELADAPALALSCESTKVDKLTLRGEDGTNTEICVQGAALGLCSARP